MTYKKTCIRFLISWNLHLADHSFCRKLRPWLGQSFEDFGNYASAVISGAAETPWRGLLANYLRSMDYESFLDLMREFADFSDEDLP